MDTLNIRLKIGNIVYKSVVPITTVSDKEETIQNDELDSYVEGTMCLEFVKNNTKHKVCLKLEKSNFLPLEPPKVSKRKKHTSRVNESTKKNKLF